VSSRGQRYDFLNIFAKYSENTKTTELWVHHAILKIFHLWTISVV
jgi:hypothetical protein